MRLAEVVEKEDVNEAMRLMEMSKDSLTASLDRDTRWDIILHSCLCFKTCFKVMNSYYGRTTDGLVI